MSALHRERINKQAKRVILVAPELRHVTDPASSRCATTANGTPIGRSYSRTRRDPGSVQGPYLNKPRWRVRALRCIGSMPAIFSVIGLAAAFVLLSGCTGPTEAEAQADTAASIHDAISQAQREQFGLLALESIQPQATPAGKP